MADAVEELTAPLEPLDDAVAGLPREPGLVAWWGSADALPDVDGPAHPLTAGYRLFAVGDATMLRNRVTRQDLYRTGVSTPRRTLAGLLLTELALAPTWIADVVLPRADEERLTAWMREHLRLTWCARTDRRERLPEVVTTMAPALDPDRERARSALARSTAAAGERGERVVGVPFRRP